MSVTGIIIAVAVVGGVGLLIGVFLSIAGNYFRVETNPLEDKVIEALPGNNCGGCGYAGCNALAAAIVKGEAPVSQCPVGGEPVAARIAEIMGVEADTADKMIAHVKCKGTCDLTFNNYNYEGVRDCRMVSFVPSGGPKSCDYGCMGFGTCVDVCEFDAIHVVNGVAVVDSDKCKACGKCIEACPKHLIEMIPYKAKYVVDCMNKDMGPLVMKACKVGCIGCSLCAKECPKEAITVADSLAHIDQEKCIGCGKCANKCPKQAITGLAR
ncbi:MAG: RnfABCDGE type electron transport complex subunit B [Lachnospiraceae bacterium]|nr:RnfABCDGE type electron transport complex subunit B [Lachnospiraceae bacterium]